MRRHKPKTVGAGVFAVRRQQDFDFRPVATELIEFFRCHGGHVRGNRERGGVAALPGGGEALLDRRTLSLTHLVGERLETKPSTFVEHRRIVRNHKQSIPLQLRDGAEDVASRGQGEA